MENSNFLLCDDPLQPLTPSNALNSEDHLQQLHTPLPLDESGNYSFEYDKPLIDSTEPLEPITNDINNFASNIDYINSYDQNKTNNSSCC